jgi:hypothetical protein
VTTSQSGGDHPPERAPGEGSADAQDDEQLVVALRVEAAKATRRLAAQLDISPAEALRRALSILDFLASLGPDEQLVVWNEKTGEADHLRFHWAAHGEQHPAAGDVVYRTLQAWSRPHPAKGVVTVHFATRDHPERRFALTAAAARELAILLMRHSKRVRRAEGSTGEDEGQTS